MPLNGYSTGRDIKITVNQADGTVLRIPSKAVTEFQSKPDTHRNTITSMDGQQTNQIFHGGWSGTLSVDRMNDAVDAWWAQQEANYFAGKDQPGGTITETIEEADGSTSQYKYLNVQFAMGDAGRWQGESNVPQSIEFYASRRVKVA